MFFNTDRSEGKKLEFKPKTNKKEKSQQKHIVSNDKKGGKFI